MSEQEARPAFDLDWLLESFAVFVIATGLIGLACALAGLFHAPQVVLGSLLVASGYGWWTRRRTAAPAVAPRAAHLLLIALVGLFFRVPAYFYVLGGQDEGLYVNMAIDLQRTGSLVPTDRVLQSIHDPGATDQYVRDNYDVRNYLPGVYRLPGESPRLQFQFYHLFPVWMAVFAGLFGIAASIHALTLLAVVSLLFVYRLTLELTSSRPAALIAGLLLATNPLHAFFSKFPVSEVPTLAFSLVAFAFLARYWMANPPHRRVRWLVLSALALMCLFTTRISGFFYLPFLLIFSAVTLVRDPDSARRIAIHRWVLSAVALYALSVFYGLRWSSFYAGDIYRSIFGDRFGPHWKAVLTGAGTITAIGWLGIWSASRSRLLARAAAIARDLRGPAIALFLLLGVVGPYQLAFTNKYLDDSLLGRRFPLAAGGWNSLAASTLVAFAIYLCPLLFVALIILAVRRWREPRIEAVLIFLLYFIFHYAVLDWVIPYQPYYARYLASELVPYTIVFVACAWAFLSPGRLQTALRAVLLISVLYGAALSAAQIGKKENDQCYETLARVAAHVDPGDLLLIDSESLKGFSDPELKTPLVFAFGLQVADILQSSLAEPAYLGALRAAHGDMYLLSSSSTPPAGFTVVDALPFKVLAYTPGERPPTDTFWRVDTRLYLSRLDRIKFGPGSRIAFHAGGVATQLLDRGWNTPEPWGVWAVGHSSTLHVDPRMLQDDGAVTRLRLRLRGFVFPRFPEQQVLVKVDGVQIHQLHFRYPDARVLAADIPLDAERVRSGRPIAIELVVPEPITPRLAGLNGDTRLIGVGLEDLELIGDGKTGESALAR